jgi:hypothetical protein
MDIPCGHVILVNMPKKYKEKLKGEILAQNIPLPTK